MSLRTTHAFSLVELSIVLVILGLLTGGILAGQSLIHAAELRAVSTESQRYIAAINSFRDKYFALPGDMNNATSFWGVAAGSGSGLDSDCFNATSTTTATCNGNSDGKIGAGTGESFRIWKQLANAGLIEGSYTDTSTDNDYTHYGMVDNTNVPASKMGAGALWYAYSLGTSSGNASYFDGSYGNVLQLGTFAAITGTPATAVLKPEDAWNIDQKNDDGLPGTGKYRARLNGSNCSTSSAITAPYNLANTNKACTPLVITGY